MEQGLVRSMFVLQFTIYDLEEERVQKLAGSLEAVCPNTSFYGCETREEEKRMTVQDHAVC